MNEHERNAHNDKGKKNAITDEEEVEQMEKDDRREIWEKDLPEVYYEFIGECYIHRIVDGGATKLVYEEDYRKVDFWLR
jgi:hypothetical protein